MLSFFFSFFARLSDDSLLVASPGVDSQLVCGEGEKTLSQEQLSHNRNKMTRTFAALLNVSLKMTVLCIIKKNYKTNVHILSSGRDVPGEWKLYPAGIQWQWFICILKAWVNCRTSPLWSWEEGTDTGSTRNWEMLLSWGQSFGKILNILHKPQNCIS